MLGYSHLKKNNIRWDGDLQSLWPASSEFVLVNLLLLHCGHCVEDWTFPHGSRKQQTNVCTDSHNETILVVRSCSVFTAPPGAHICWKCAYVFRPPVGYSGSLSTLNETCNKDKGYCTKKNCQCTSYKSSRTMESGVHLFASLEKTTCRHCSILRSLMSKRPLQVSPFLHGCCTVHELRGIVWLSNLVFTGLSDALGQKDNENLFTVLISIHPHHVFEIMV